AGTDALALVEPRQQPDIGAADAGEAFGRQGLAANVADNAGQVANGAVGGEDGGLFGAFGANTKQFHGGSPKIPFWPYRLACRPVEADLGPIRPGLRGLRADGALFEDDIAVKAAFPGLDDGGGLARPLVEGEALDGGKAHARLVAPHDVLEQVVDGLAGVRIADHRHADGRLLDEIVERHQGQDGLEHVGGGNAIGADRRGAEELGREIGVGDDDLGAMAHGAQRGEQFGSEQRRYALEHDGVSVVQPKGKSAVSAANSAPSANKAGWSRAKANNSIITASIWARMAAIARPESAARMPSRIA